ncbi:hypothetical protein JCM16303_007142, partial [Sporobolomyces ruberrimus]
ETILELVRNEVLRTSTSSSSIALVASSSSSSADKFSRPPPSPCPACDADHWLAKCAQRDAYRASKAKAKKSKSPPSDASGNFASVLESIDGVELWLSAPSSLVSSSSLSSLTLDSGATRSMCGDAKLFSNFRACEPSAVGGILSGTNGLKLTGIGSLTVKLSDNSIVKINKARLVPGISRNLLSSSQLFDLHGIVSTFGESATLSHQDRVVATGSRLSNGLYQLNGTLIDPLQGASALLASSSLPIELTTWHRRFAHLSPRSLMSLSKSDQVVGLEVEKGGSEDRSRVCNVCHIAHSSRLPFPRSDRCSSAPLELIHSDVLSINVPSLGGRRYVVTFVDDFSRMLWVEPLARKSDVLEAFKKLKALVENESGKKITRFRSDNGGEFVSHAFDSFLAEHGIKRETPPPYSPQSNGVAERVNRTIVEGLISLLSQAGAPKDLWAEALQAFVFAKNRSPHAALDGKVPLSVWRDRPVSVSMLRVSGCRAWHTVTNGQSKLDDKAIPLVFVGYDGDTTAYRLFDPETRKMIRSRDTRFVENEFPLANPSSSSSGSPSPVITPADIVSVSIPPTSPPPSPSVDAPTTPIARCSAPDAPRANRDFTRRLPNPPAPPIFEREIAPPPESPDPLDCLTDPFASTLAEVDALVASAGSELEAAEDNFTLPSLDPRNHRKVMQDSHSDRWRSGEDDEFTSLRDEYKVFHSVDRDQLSSNAKVIRCRFVFRRKKDQHGRVSGHKVRLVAQGFSQRPGVDFRETFAPV